MKIRIGTKLTLSVAIFTAIVIATIGYIAFRTARQSLENQVYAQLASAAKFRADTISNYLYREQAVLATIANAGQIRENLIALSKEHKPSALEPIKSYLDELSELNATLENQHIDADENGDHRDHFMVVSSKGTVLYAPEKCQIHNSLSLDKLLTLCAKPQISEYELFKFEIHFGHQIRDDANNLVGFIVMSRNSDEITDTLGKRTGMGSTGETYIVDKPGHILTPVRTVAQGQNYCLSSLSYVTASDNNFSKVNGSFLDYKKAPSIGTVSNIAGTDLYVVAEIDSAEAFAPVAALKTRIYIAGTCFGIVVLFTGILLWRKLTRPIEQLTIGAQRLGSGNLDYRLDIQTGDELEELGVNFNNMASDLKAAYTGLEEKIAQRTSELIHANEMLKQEISERLRMNQELKRLQNQQKSLLDNLPDLVWLKDSEGRFIAVNKAFADSTGLSQPELIGKSDIDIWPATLARTYLVDDLDVMKNSKPKIIQEPIADKTGRILWVETIKTPIYDETGKVCGITGTARDITARKRAEEELERQSAKFSAMISGMDQTVIFADANDRIIEINPHGTDFLKLSKNDVCGKLLWEINSKELNEKIKLLLPGFKSVPHSKAVMVQQKLNGADVVVRIQPIYRDSSYEGVLLNIVDVTELVKARDQAQEANKAKSQFLANMSHEIRTPMNSILGFAELLKQEDMTAQQLLYANTIYSSGQNLLGIINDILNLSKIEAGKIELRPVDVNTAEIAESVLSTVRLLAQNKGLTINVEIDDCPSAFRCDSDKLRQVLINLLGNAIKFTSKGFVKLCLRQIPASKNQQDIYNCENAIYFCVEDSGIGIKPENQQKVFKAFTQIDNTDSRSQAGTGLGLTISKKLVDLLGGNLEVSSTWGVGSRFYFSIPCKQPLHEPVPAHESHSQQPSSTVVVIEDDAPTRNMLKESLEASGFKVTAYENGRDAQKQISRIKPSAVILDINLPDANGFEILRDLKQNGSTVQIPVIVCSIVPESMVSLSLGAIDHITKPVNAERLIATVKRATANQPHAGVVAIDDDPLTLESYKAVLNAHYDLRCFDSGQKGLEFLKENRQTGLVMVDLVMPGMDGFEVITEIRKAVSKDLPIVVVTDKELTETDRSRLKDDIQAICKKSQLRPDQLLLEIKRYLQKPSLPLDHKPTVLLADDVQENRMLMEILLEKAGYEVTSVENGKLAFEAAEKTRYDLILMDVQMPVMDGFEATKKIKAESMNKSTPIIALTARAMKGDNIVCYEAGCDDYICKPVKHEVLLEKLGRYIKQAQSIKSAACGGDVVSDLSCNPDYHKVIETFINNLPGRVDEMKSALEHGNLQELAQKAHALKGLGGFAGFPIYTQKAKEIEEILQSRKLDEVKKQIDELAHLVARTKMPDQNKTNG